MSGWGVDPRSRSINSCTHRQATLPCSGPGYGESLTRARSDRSQSTLHCHTTTRLHLRHGVGMGEGGGGGGGGLPI